MQRGPPVEVLQHGDKVIVATMKIAGYLCEADAVGPQTDEPNGLEAAKRRFEASAPGAAHQGVDLTHELIEIEFSRHRFLTGTVPLSNCGPSSLLDLVQRQVDPKSQVPSQTLRRISPPDHAKLGHTNQPKASRGLQREPFLISSVGIWFGHPHHRI